MTPGRPRSLSYAQIETALRWSALVVLLAGLSGSVLIWRAQDRIERDNGSGQDADPDNSLPTLDSRKHLREVELYGGKAGVFMEEAKGLFHGKPLAKTIAVVSVITAAGLLLVTVRSPD